MITTKQKGFLFRHDYPPDPLLDSRTQNLKRLLAKAGQPGRIAIIDWIQSLWAILTAKETT